MLSCQQMTVLVTDYLEGGMSFADRWRFQMHLGMCKQCRRYLKQMKALISVLGRLPDEPMPDDVRDEMRKRFAAWHGARGARIGPEPEAT
jgi:predicted anti-sigma-YlaC factor YlaD